MDDGAERFFFQASREALPSVVNSKKSAAVLSDWVDPNSPGEWRDKGRES
jgi:hypothetical protein